MSTSRSVATSCSMSAGGKSGARSSGVTARSVPGCSTIKDSSDVDGDRLTWKWLKGAALAVGDFGDPVAGTDHYVTCVYDASGRILEALAPAAGICRGRPCWKTSGTTSLKYNDPLLLPQGVSTVTLTAGAAGASSVKVKAKKRALPTPALPLSLPVTVQLQSANGKCWEARYSTPIVNDPEKFKAKAD